MTIWNIITIVSAAIMTILILLQVRGAGLGAGLGGSGSSEMNTVRRGSDKSIYRMTIIAAIAFALSILLDLILV
ncbi:MAG: protein translocase SecG subunit [Candidatus Saccharimonadales bacterium]|jgi:protein translocase SecG subunit